jgi:hypothetical protein
MSTAPTPPAPAAPPAKREITLISHSMLFYWWPIWVIGFVMAGLTWYEDSRLAIMPSQTSVGAGVKGEKAINFTVAVNPERDASLLEEAARRSNVPGQVANPFPTRVSHKAWMGPLFCVVLLLTVVITNVQLRGLWSFLVLLMMLVLALIISLVGAWDKLLTAVGDLHIYINMAGYLFIASVVFGLWAVSVFIFDQRTYIKVTPGQIQVCEHVGAAIRTYDTVGLSFEKQRDDIFRHWLLGFFSGDLIVKTAGAERETIRLPNVLWIGWRLEDLQKLLAEKAIVPGA